MPHVTAPAPRHHDRAAARLARPPALRRPQLSPLDLVSLQIVAGFLAPLPVIQLGHWLFGWNSVAVMFGGQ